MRFAIVAIPMICLASVVSSMAAADDATPHWIWASSQRAADQDVRLTNSFEVTGAVVRATLNLAADFTRCRVFFNDETLLDIDEYGPWMELDLSDRIRRGENTLTLQCRSGDGPAAIAFSVEIVSADQSQQWSVSGLGTVATLDSDSGSAVSLGLVSPEFWNVSGRARVSAFDDYEQWRQASGVKQGTSPVTFSAQPGFEVDLVRSAQPDESSWVSMAFDPQGRVTIAREDEGLLRMTLAPDGSGVKQVETINDTLQECRGLLYAYDSLYVNANNSKGMYRLRDTNGDDQFDEVKLLREFPGKVGHGRNDLALGPDGMIYSIHGDSVDLPTEEILDRTSPFRITPQGEPPYHGHLIRTDRDAKSWELVACGLRNPFGIDFNNDGELFTYDADNEYDMGAAWYRPTRINQLVSGADFGWRRVPSGQWKPYFPDHADNALPVVDVGKGSPTSLKSGKRSSFPEHYRRSIFALDWAYGRILACHFSPRGAGYACRVEPFLKGRPLNVTDLDFGPTGDMYLVTGGRKTQSAMYRIRYVGPDSTSRKPTLQQSTRREYSRQARELRRRLAGFHGGPDPEARATAWNQMASPDPVIRNAARLAIEHQPVEQWKSLALAEQDGEIAATALLALARSGVQNSSQNEHEAVLRRLGTLDLDSLTALAKLSVIHAYRLIYRDFKSPDKNVVDAVGRRLVTWLDSIDTTETAPLGSGDSVRHELARLVAERQIPGVMNGLMEMLQSASRQRDRMHALYMLCQQRADWSMQDRREFFEALQELERTAFSGAGMPGRLQQIRERGSEFLSDDERTKLGVLLEPATLNAEVRITVKRPFVRKWKLADLSNLSKSAVSAGNPEHGETLFRDALCASCHRFEGRGGVVGPDLSSLAARFSRQDILASIVSPSDVIAEKYRSTQIVTVDGRVLNGHVVTGGDYRASVLRIIEDARRPDKFIEIAKGEIEQHQPSSVSPMPEGLLDTLTAEEILDLLAYLSGTHKNQSH